MDLIALILIPTVDSALGAQAGVTSPKRPPRLEMSQVFTRSHRDLYTFF